MQSLKSISIDKLEPPLNRITGVRFGLFSADDIDRLSSVEVNDTVINKSGIVQRYGINDSHLGTVVRSMLCSTCANNMDDCPGHNGHINLVEPVINIEFVSHIHKILTCVCFYCSRLLMPVDYHKYDTIMAIKNKKKRLSEIYDFCKKYRTCVSWNDYQTQRKNKRKNGAVYSADELNLSVDTILKTQSGCGGVQPTFTKEDVIIRATFVVQKDDFDELPQMTPNNMLHILKFISKDDIDRLGFNSEHSAPSSMIWSKLLVPPVAMRPSRSKSNNTKIGGEDDLTIRLRSIVKSNNQLKTGFSSTEAINLAQYQLGSVIFQSKQELVNIEPAEECPNKPKQPKKVLTKFLQYIDLQKNIAGYQDAKYLLNAMDGSEYGRDKKCIRNRFAGQKAKKGRMRNSILGKRMDFSARTVITPDNYMKLTEVGVPIWMCKILTFPARVTKFNIHRLTEMVRNGPDIYPGANYVSDPSKPGSSSISLKFVDRFTVQLKFGQIVKRHLCQDDWVLFNRQPSLHKMSLMAHRVRPVSGNSFRLHVACTGPYNADFDGDEMNLSVLLDEFTRSEAQEILAVDKNIVKDMVPLVCFQQHSLAAAYLLTADGELITREWACQLWLQNPEFDLSHIPIATHSNTDGDECFTGKQVMAACLPRKFFMKYKDVIIIDSVFTTGQLNKDTLNNGIVYTLWKDFGGELTARLIGGIQLMLESYLSVKGLSIGVDDCYMDLPTNITDKVKTAINYVETFPEHNPSDTGKKAEIIENNICLVLDKCRDVVGDFIVNRMKDAKTERNGLYEMVASGSKGNITNIIQNVGMVGQQRNHKCMRMSQTTSHFNVKKDIAAAHGMVTRSFLRGLRPHEYFNHLIGSRVGLVDTAVKTSETGYCQRRIGKAMEDVVVHSDKVVRNAHKDIIQFVYGDDGFDAASVEFNRIRFLTMSEEQVLQFYRCFPGTGSSETLMDLETNIRWAEQIREYTWVTQVSDILVLRESLLDLLIDSEFDDTCLCPVQFDRLLDRAEARSTSKLLDITPFETQSQVRTIYEQITKSNILRPTIKMDGLFWDRCSTANLWKYRKLDKTSLTWFLVELYNIFLTKSITPNESVGLCAAQNCSEPLTQMTLNRFHQSGQFSNLVTGVARIKEIVNVVKTPGMPSMSIIAVPGQNLEKLGANLIQVIAHEVIDFWDTVLPEGALVRDQMFKSVWSKWNEGANIKYLVIHMDKTKCIRKNTSPLILANALRYSEIRKRVKDFNAYFSFSAIHSDKWWVCFSCHTTDAIWTDTKNTLLKKNNSQPSDDMITLFIYEKMILDCLVKGVKNVEDFFIDTKTVTKVISGKAEKTKIRVILTKGSNLSAILARKDINSTLSTTNFISEIDQTLGIDAACETIEEELRTVMAINKAHCGTRHIKLLADAMCFRGILSPMTYQGICHQNTSVMKKAAFEKAMDSFIWGAVQGHKDKVSTATESIAWNGRLRCGTGCVLVYSEDVEEPPSDLVDLQQKTYNSRSIVYVPPDISSILQPKTRRIFAKKRKINIMSSETEKVVFQTTETTSNLQFVDSKKQFFPSSPKNIKRQKFSVTFSTETFAPYSP
jgi:DNA-directed RNA polymerase II subunit RPB1